MVPRLLRLNPSTSQRLLRFRHWGRSRDESGGKTAWRDNPIVDVGSVAWGEEAG